MSNGTATQAAYAESDLHTLMSLYPLGSRWQFRSYHPAIWPHDWRRKAERAPWGMRRGDLVEVTGYAASLGLPEGLLMVRVRDGTTAVLFAAELIALQPLPASVDSPATISIPSTSPAPLPAPLLSSPAAVT